MTDKETFENIYKENYSFIRNFVILSLHNAQLAEEVVQETFYEASKNVNRLYKHPNIRGWLINTTKYNIRDKLKSEKRHKALLLENMTYFPQINSNFSEDLSLEEKLRQVLNSADIELLLLHYEHGYTLVEIAEMKGITENACKVRIHRIRKKLKSSHKDIFISLFLLVVALYAS